MKKKFSIVIPLAPWRETDILKCVEEQDYPKENFEVIVEKGLNVPINRNNGVARSNGETIIFLDDDGFIEKDFLKKVEEFLYKYPEIDIIGGPQLTPKDDKFFARSSGYVLSNQVICPGICNRYKPGKLNLDSNSDNMTGALMVIKRKVFDKLQFDPKLYPGDDVSFVDNAKIIGFKIGYSPEIKIYHKRRGDIKGLFKQIYFYGNARSRKERSSILKKPQFLAPTLFLLYLVLLAIISFFYFNIIFYLPLIIYIIAILVISMNISVKNHEIKSILILPFISFLIHVSYGIGFISGLISNKQKEGI